ncbi:MAG: sodium:calcium symporter [Opitutaceae bacterium]|nr:sodium:calcium symporter [Opitutaceae bacterium]
MNFLTDFIKSIDFASPWTFFTLFLITSMVMLWRLEAMLDHGLEGTALGTLVMPYCSGLGNLLFVAVVAVRGSPLQDVLTNCLVNNVTNLTLVLGLPALLWGLAVVPGRSAGSGSKRGGGGAASEINRLSLLLTLVAVLFFTGAAWLLGRDGRFDRVDGALLVGLFLFWQSFHVFDVLKHNLRRKVSFGVLFYLDTLVVLACAYGLYVSIDWLVAWLSTQQEGSLSAQNLGWLSGWLMVLPNALLAIYWGWKRRADIVLSSQAGDGHICIPLCLGLFALYRPVAVPDFFANGVVVLAGAAVAHVFSCSCAADCPVGPACC